MKISECRILVVMALLLLLFSLTAQDVGYIEYLSGLARLQSEGKIREIDDMDIGALLYEHDLISTGSDGHVELFLQEAGTSGTRLTVHQNTVFTVESGGQRHVPDTTLKVLHGSIALRVSRLVGSSLTIQTETASMGVRGTDFQIVTGPDGSVLVVCTEGRVTATTADNKEFEAVPGQGVEKLPAENMAAVAITRGQEQAYIEDWQRTRQEIFRSGAHVFTAAYYRQWMRMRPMFKQAYDELVVKSALLQRQGKRAMESGFAFDGNMNAVKADVASEILGIRRVFPMYEQIYYRLLELEGHHRQGFGSATFADGTDSDLFFASFMRNRLAYERELAVARHLLRMYLYINRSASLGDESLFEDIMLSDPLGGGRPMGNPF